MAEGKILLILVIALLVLGPERLPKLAADVGRWVGRARAMARQLQTQLDQEVHVQTVLREQVRAATTMTPPTAATTMTPPTAATTMTPASAPTAPAAAPADAAPVAADPTHSHAHPPGEVHPDYAAGIAAAAAAVAAHSAPIAPTAGVATAPLTPDDHGPSRA
jgi:Tat protein translocase TatB subunit